MGSSISKDFSLFSLARFAFPSVVMMVFTSLYTMVDGVFVSRVLGTTALSAVNLFYPLFNVIIATGIMLGTGGSAVIARKIGEGQTEEARSNFSLIVLAGVLSGVLIAALSLGFMEAVLRFLGAEGEMLPLCREYTTVFMFFAPLCMLQLIFQYLFVTAGRPGLGLAMSIAGGLTNMVLDYLFLVHFSMGMAGAALASGIGIAVPALFGLGYFRLYRRGYLHLSRPRWEPRVLVESCYNGSSEMVGNMALAVVTLMYNIIMMDLLGQDGVAAITIVLYVHFVLCAVFAGFSMGVAPVISYNHGSGNSARSKRVFRHSMAIIALTSLLSYIWASHGSGALIKVFVSEDNPVYGIAAQGFSFFSVSFLFVGVNIFASAMFTALSDGKVSAIISFMRTFVFISAGLAVLPGLFHVKGVWMSITAAELLSLILSAAFLFCLRKKYRYG
nr:MATE family efflux transporter [uncultured Dethiosulfovibrio sp.]